MNSELITKRDGTILSSGESKLAYASKFRQTMKDMSNQSGGAGDVRISVLRHYDEQHCFVRVLFSRTGQETESFNDPEWNVCTRWVNMMSERNRMPVKPGRVIISGDLCVLIKERDFDIHDAQTDAENLFSLIVKQHNLAAESNSIIH